jgi:L-iditol 2-dehydrogenase
VRAAVLTRPGQIAMETRAEPTPGPHEVRVRVASVGICGSDVHYYQHGRIGRYVVERPLVLGHECSGVIDQVGPGVAEERIGQRVVIEPGVPCRRCRWCKTGRYNLCPFVEFLATPPIDGALTDLVVAPDDFTHPIPDHVSLADAALLEPTAVAVHAIRRGAVTAGSTVAIFGAGPVGLLVLQVARAFGARSISVIDPEPSRLDAAERNQRPGG